MAFEALLTTLPIDQSRHAYTCRPRGSVVAKKVALLGILVLMVLLNIAATSVATLILAADSLCRLPYRPMRGDGSAI